MISHVGAAIATAAELDAETHSTLAFFAGMRRARAEMVTDRRIRRRNRIRRAD